MLSLYEKIKIRLIILFLLAALSFIGLFFIINYQLVSERAVKRADSRFELIQKNVGFGRDELRYISGYGEAVRLAPRKFFAFLAH